MSRQQSQVGQAGPQVAPRHRPHCFDLLVTGGVLTINPATLCAAPKHAVKRGKTLVLTTDQAPVLIDTSTSSACATAP
jgi:hypothetical protein